MATKMTAEQAHKLVEAYGEKARPDIRVVKNMKVGQVVRQGDVYLKMIKSPEIDESYAEYRNNQIAPGNTKGSRHIVSGNVKMFIKKEMSRQDNATTGPVISASEEFCVTHPEHAHMQLPAGDYQVTYQLNFAQQHRVRD